MRMRQGGEEAPAGRSGAAGTGGGATETAAGGLPCGRLSLSQQAAEKPLCPIGTERLIFCYLASASRILTAPASCAARICSVSWVSPQPLPCHRFAAGA